MAEITNFSGEGWMYRRQADAFPEQTLSQKKWEAYISGVDAIEDEIRRQVQNEGDRNLKIADEGRQERREIWQEQWEKFLAFSKANMERVKEADEADDSLYLAPEPEERLRAGMESSARLRVEVSEPVNKTEKLWAPYEELSQDGGLTITYNGVTFLCNRENHTISLGDTSNPKNVIQIPLSGGGTLNVNKNNLADLGRAIGMFSPEDIGIILRTIAEFKKAESMKEEMEEEEMNTLDKMAGHGNGTEKEKADSVSESTGIVSREDDRERSS